MFPVLTSREPVGWNEYASGGGLNEEEEQKVVDAGHD